MAFQVGRLVALITGGARGLGRATAEHFVKRGGKVAIIDLPESDGEEVAKEISKENCIFCPCDVTHPGEVNEAVELTKGRFGGLHVLVNCAGTSLVKAIYNIGKELPHSLDEFEQVMESNVIGTFNTIRLAVSQMASNEPDADGQCGVIINTSSIAAMEGERSQLAYSMSKAAVNSMTLPLSRELCRQGIRVNTISPGYFKTEMFDETPRDIIEFVSNQTPLPSRFGYPEEFAALVQTIVETPYINGEIIRLDGGLRPAY